MKIIFWGTPFFSIPCLNSLINSHHEILATVTQPDRRRTRSNKLTRSPIKERSSEVGIPVITTESIRHDINTQKRVTDLNADIYIVVAFGQILPLKILKQPKLGAWNCHASLLPKWRGAAPIQRSIANCDVQTGVDFMLMKEGLDTGPILLEKKIDIKLLDNHTSISRKLSLISSELIIEGLGIIEKSQFEIDGNYDKLDLRDQSKFSIEPTYAQQISREDKKIDWNDNCLKIHKKIMAFHPNTFTFVNNRVLKIEKSEPLIDKYRDCLSSAAKDILDEVRDIRTSPGKVIALNKRSGIIIATNDYPIIITKAKLEGKTVQECNNLIQQLNLSIGEKIG